MFTCPACWRNIVSSLAGDLPGASASRLVRSSPSIPTPRSLRRPGDQSIRTSATLRGLSRPHHRRDALQVLKSKAKTQALTGNKKRNALGGSPSYARAKEANAKQSLTAKGMTKLEIQAQKEAVFLVDPLRLANAVTDNLRQDNFEKAKALVIASDRHGQSLGGAPGSVNNIVSWNHLMDWLMAKRLPKDALKLYQDMKKRGHAPDAYTYTILLRGLAENHSRVDDAANTAIKLYNSIFQPGSGVKTSTLITNAALTVCAKSGDMDALWSIAGRMPETRRGSADHWTYTTVLNAMQSHLLKQLAQAGDGEDAKGLREFAITKAMDDARMLWRDVVKKWRAGDISVDEKLVSAMGRLLLTSGRNLDALDVFELAKQTMGIYVDHQSLRDSRKALNAEVSSGEQQSEKAQLPENDESSNTEENAIAGRGAHIFDTVVEGGRASQPVTAEERAYQLLTGEQQSTSLVHGDQAKHAVFARPGNNTLSMLLEASTNLKKAHIGKVYWELLTDPAGAYNVEPDSQNCLSYMRLLRQARSSQSALEMLQRSWTGSASDFLRRRGTYVIAMSTCIRNKLNPNIFTIASRMLDVMQDKAADFREAREDQEQQELLEQEESEHRRRKGLEVRSLDMDPRVMTMYLELAMHTTKGLSANSPLQKLPNGDLDYERDPVKNNTMRALNRLGPDTINLLKMVKMMRDELAFIARHASVPAAAQRKMKLGTRVGEKAHDLLDFLKMVVSATDRILHVNYRLEEDGMGPLDKSTLMDIRIQRAKMTSYIETLSKAMGLQMLEKSGMAGNGAAASQKRERPLSRRQKQEKERERRNQSLVQEMVRTGQNEKEVRQSRAQRVQKKPRAGESVDLWGHDTAPSYTETFTELRG